MGKQRNAEKIKLHIILFRDKHLELVFLVFPLNNVWCMYIHLKQNML